jgi:glyoxylase-like metal-dependent hydrolase (beta-lactamase superfamily II)
MSNSPGWLDAKYVLAKRARLLELGAELVHVGSGAAERRAKSTMSVAPPHRASRRSVRSLWALLAFAWVPAAWSTTGGEAGTPYPNMPRIAPPGVQIDHYLPVPESSQGAAIDPAKGYRTEDLGQGLYFLTDNMYQSMFLVYAGGVVVIDAPPSFAKHIPAAIAEVTALPITHMIYSHSHIDHIGGASGIPGHPIIIAHRETKRLLEEANDPKRPIPTVVFDQQYSLHVGGQLLKLSYHGYGHSPGNIYIYAPKQQVLMVVDVVAPGWMSYRSLSLSRDIPGLFRQVNEISKMPFDKFVGGHVARIGDRHDVLVQAQYLRDLAAAAKQSLSDTRFGFTVDSQDQTNPWALADNYMDRVTIECVNAMSDPWEERLAGFDAYIWEHCIAMEESLRAD